MKNIFAIILVCAVSISVMAQTKQKEVGLIFSDLDNFGFSYKVGTEKALWRFNSVLLHGGKSNLKYDDDEDWKDESKSSGYGLSLGREYRKPIVENLELRYGLDLTFDYYSYGTELYSKENKDETFSSFNNTRYTYGVAFVFGFNYVINNRLVLGAELLPFINYQKEKELKEGRFNEGYPDGFEEETTSLRYGLSNSSARLSIAYRF